MADSWIDQYIKGLSRGGSTNYLSPVAKKGVDPGLLNLLDPTGKAGSLPQNVTLNNNPKALTQMFMPPGANAQTLNQTPQDPYADLNNIYKQLLANLSNPGGVPVIDEAGIRKSVASKYDPQIGRINREVKIAKENYGYNKDTLKSLYDELEDDYRKEVKGIESYYKGQSDSEKARMDALQERINTNYQDTFADQQAEFENLGIEDALPGSVAGQEDDLAYLESLSQLEGESAQRDISGQERANRDYYNKGAVLANNRGAEELTDLLREFSQYNMMRQGDITDLEAARSSDISALLAQAQQARATALSQNQNSIFDNLLKAGNYGMDLRKMQLSALSQAQGQQPTTIGKGLTGAQQILSSIPDQNRQRQLMGFFQNLMQKQQIREGRFETASGDVVNMTPEQAVNYMLEAAGAAGMSDQEKLTLMNAVYAYYGRF